MSIATLQYHIKADHPDYEIAYQHCYEARRLRNGINAICRTDYLHRVKSEKLDYFIVEEYGLKDRVLEGDIGKSGVDLVGISKTVKDHQKIDLPSKVIQATARALADSWSSFFALRKKNIKANIPGYSKVFHTAEYNTQSIHRGVLRRDRRVRPTGWKEGVTLPEYIDSEQVKSACITPVSTSHFILNVRYEEAPVEGSYSPVPGLTASVDPGLNNLLTIAFSDFREGIIVDGNPLKEINSTYNWMISDLQCKLDVEKNNISRKINEGVDKDSKDFVRVCRPYSSRLGDLWDSRRNKLRHYYTSATNAVVRSLCEAGVETVVIGWNEGIKRGSNLGKRNNRKFVQVPLKKILLDLERKLVKAGVRVVWVEESYTSKASFIDNDPLPVRGDGGVRVFSGRRVSRGEYRTAGGVLWNADLNGAYNILRKYEPRFRFPGVGDTGDSVTGVAIGVVVPRCRRLTFPY